jgi:Zn-finger nucleic acid-binding protein
MNNAEMEPFIKMELKYCERCGGLWTRPRGAVENRCQRCVAEEEQLTRLWRERGQMEGRADVAQAALVEPVILSMEAVQL